jgi:hypothetical protein
MAKREDFEARKKYWNDCDPATPLIPSDPRCVDIDEDMPGARGQSCVDLIADTIEVAMSPQCMFFAGLPGSGKSTEINRLALRLRDENRARLLPIVIDAEEMLDLHNRHGLLKRGVKMGQKGARMISLPGKRRFTRRIVLTTTMLLVSMPNLHERVRSRRKSRSFFLPPAQSMHGGRAEWQNCTHKRSVLRHGRTDRR